jgi:hypothetical protein
MFDVSQPFSPILGKFACLLAKLVPNSGARGCVPILPARTAGGGVHLGGTVPGKLLDEVTTQTTYFL